ncbi:MAG: sigma-70 family RNA polymerase sigma factor [Planctomycetes bacterium]|nr:sigma-70 family RNA polymerase sigma factor [Planctomycetota bacterium]
MSSGDSFVELLGRWRAGDPAALGELLRGELPWIEGIVRRRLGPLLRQRGDTRDFVQDAVIDVLRDGPRLIVRERAEFRAVLARIVENNLRDAHDRHSAGRRDVRREVPLSSRSSIVLDPSLRSATQPGDAAARDEERALIRLAVELLAPDDRAIIVLRGYRELEFHECAERLGIGVKAAQMRFARAVPRLARKLEQLRRGDLARALSASDGGDAATGGA